MPWSTRGLTGRALVSGTDFQSKPIHMRETFSSKKENTPQYLANKIKKKMCQCFSQFPTPRLMSPRPGVLQSDPPSVWEFMRSK